VSTKPKDWHSRRHRTDEAHTKARNAWLDKLAEKKESAKARQLEADERTPEQQLQRLDRMFGAGLGAKKERAKIAKRMAK
jgi:hypothetical protein